MKVLAVTNGLPSAKNPRNGTFIEQQIKGLRDIGLRVEVILIDRANGGSIAYRKARQVVRKHLVNYKQDVVHVMYGGVMADLVTMETSNLPTVVSFCGVDLLGANYGPLSYRLRTRIGTLASYRSARRADGIVVKSRNLEKGLPSDVNRSFVSIIPNGVCLNRFSPRNREECRLRLDWPKDKFHVLFSTTDRKDAKKRLPLAESAVDLLKARGVRIEMHGLSNTPHDEVPIWLNAADVLLLTSMYDEGSPNIVKEALACNRPVVSVDVGDVKERISGVDGCFLAEPNPNDIADKLFHVYLGPRVVCARDRMRKLSLERVAKRLALVYKKTIRRFEEKMCKSVVSKAKASHPPST
ncbi:glycosyltransferase [Acidobacteriota bacterium]